MGRRGASANPSPLTTTILSPLAPSLSPAGPAELNASRARPLASLDRRWVRLRPARAPQERDLTPRLTHTQDGYPLHTPSLSCPSPGGFAIAALTWLP
ncbi:hypothetical protein EV122DRAFT_285612 [Schizophyllum commune]